ncbi:MAG TPA: hypothetical protein VHD33_03480 [Legionellaceae bacterium]|nr:hypothetical protein [Legionellaceae bacterium]
MKVYGILFSEEEDNEGNKYLLSGLQFPGLISETGIPIINNKGNLLGRVTDYMPVYNAITDESATLAMKADLVESAPDGDENVLTGGSYLQLKYPFCKINAYLLDHPALKEAINAGNLYFGFEAKSLKQIANTLFKYSIEKVTLTISPKQKCSKVYFKE